MNYPLVPGTYAFGYSASVILCFLTGGLPDKWELGIPKFLWFLHCKVSCVLLAILAYYQGLGSPFRKLFSAAASPTSLDGSLVISTACIYILLCIISVSFQHSSYWFFYCCGVYRLPQTLVKVSYSLSLLWPKWTIFLMLWNLSCMFQPNFQWISICFASQSNTINSAPASSISSL